jgi:dTDP-4-amino-4,6-dideoxygalactose transaminase
MLLKKPQQTTHFTRRLQFTSSARVAWHAILKNVMTSIARTPRLLLPAYIGQNEREGSGVFDPIRQLNCEHAFYSLDDRLTPCENDIERQLETEQPDLLLVIHYFGFVKLNMDRIRNLCDKHQVILVEDCAHAGVFDERATAGVTGDFSFHSLHKFFAVDSGGALRTNRQTSQQPAIAEQETCDSAVLEQVLRSDVQAICSKRRDNYKFLMEQLVRIDELTPLWKLDSETVPHSFPVRIANGARERLYFHLLEQGMPTIALYYQLADELKQADHPTSFEISNSILNLPVHQDTTNDDLIRLVNEIEVFFGY